MSGEENRITYDLLKAALQQIGSVQAPLFEEFTRHIMRNGDPITGAVWVSPQRIQWLWQELIKEK